MKKLFAVLLSAAMLVGTVFAFAACGNTNNLKVATNAYFPPFEYLDGNSFTGVDIEIASGMAEDLGYEGMTVNNMEFDAIIPSIQSGLSDIGMAGITINEKRKEAVDFTDEYYESAQVIIVKSDDTTFDDCTSGEDIENKLKTMPTGYKIGTQRGTTGYMYSAGSEDFGYDGFSNISTFPYTTGALAVHGIVNGRVNAVIIDKQPAIMIAQSVSGVKVISEYELTSEAYAFCVRKGNTELLEKANAYLRKIKENGELDRIISSFFDGTATFKHENK